MSGNNRGDGWMDGMIPGDEYPNKVISPLFSTGGRGSPINISNVLTLPSLSVVSWTAACIFLRASTVS